MAAKKPIEPTPTLALALDLLRKHSSRSVREGMARFAIPNENAIGVAVGDIRKIAKKLGADHALAIKLWEDGLYEARLLACFVDDPNEVTPSQMDRWVKDFDSWALCDTACFHLFEKTTHAWTKIPLWARRAAEFEKRAAFALLASVSLHDKFTEDTPFAECLSIIEKAADDHRNFVKKAVSWALRSLAERSLPLNALSVDLARRLAESSDSTKMWIGKDVLRELSKPAAAKRLAAKAKRQR